MRSKAKKILITTETVETITIRIGRESRRMSNEMNGLSAQPRYEIHSELLGMLSGSQPPSYTDEIELPEIEP